MMCLVFCNSPKGQGATIARQLIEERLAACVNVVPGIRSFYRWNDEICEDDEETLLIKCAEDQWPVLRDRLEDIHPYEVPEILLCEIRSVNTAFLKWIMENSKSL